MPGDHVYVTEPSGGLALHAGYKYYGVTCHVFLEEVKGTEPVYRCFNGTTGDHFYTMNRAEYDNAVKSLGYTSEGVAWFMYPQAGDRAPLKRYYNMVTHDHLYVTDVNEAKVANLESYTPEGVAGYVLTRKEVAEDGTRAVPLYWWYSA